MLFIAIILAIVLVIVILLLPSSITSKLSGVAVGVGMIFTAYSLYLTVQNDRRDSRRRQIDHDHEYWMRIFSSFMMQPELVPMHQQIYGSSLNMQEHTMFSMMMQVVENISEGQEFGISKIDESWRNAIARWVAHPLFEEYWQENRQDYSLEAQRIVDELRQ